MSHYAVVAARQTASCLENLKATATDDFALGEVLFLKMLKDTQGVDITLAELKAAGEHLERAIARYREVLRLEPENLSARLGLAWCLLQFGDKTTAIAEFRAALDAAWIKEKEFRPADWKARSTASDGSHHLSELLDKKEDVKEIAKDVLLGRP